MIAASLALAVGLVSLGLSPLLARQPEPLTRITVASDGDRDSESPGLNADGTKIVFHSDADFLDQGIGDNQFEIWLYDTAAMTYTRLSTASNSNRTSENPILSPDGSTVAFDSDSDLRGEGIRLWQYEVWRYEVMK